MLKMSIKLIKASNKTWLTRSTSQTAGGDHEQAGSRESGLQRGCGGSHLSE